MIGDLMLRRSMRSPSEVRISPAESLLPTNRLSAIHCISPGVEQHRAAPPFLEFEEARRFGVDLGIDVVGLFPVGVGRVQRLEIGDEAGAVENAVRRYRRRALSARCRRAVPPR